MPEQLPASEWSELDRRVAAVATEIAQIETENAQEALVFAHLLAAAYALRRSIACGSTEVSDPLPKDADSAMRLTAAAVAEGRQPHESWLAGFYLAAAEERIASAGMRVKRYRDIARPDGPPTQRQLRLITTRRDRAEDMAAAVGRLEEISRLVLPA